MALSWTDIFPDVDGEPIRASLDEVESVSTMFERMADASQRILDEFEQVTSDAGTGSLEGDAADAFRDIVDKVTDSLGDLPGVCDDAHGALADHLSRLGDLRSEAASALARARTHWEAHEDAVRTLSSRRSSHNQATSDLDSLPPAGSDPAADADRTAAEDGVEQSGRLLAAAQGSVDSAADDLRASREEWGRLRGDEDELNDRTADRLDDISLGDLEDPSWWESILGSAFDLVMDLTGLDALIDLVAAIASGDWAAALWALRELLDRVLMIVAVIALFTPLGPLVLALVAIKMAASLTLYATKWPHPESGQTIGLTDVAMDSADLLGAAGDVIIAGRAAAAINAATPPSGAASAATPPSNVVPPTASSGGDLPEITVSRSRHPESAQHVEDAQNAGHPTELTIDRQGATQRRRESMRGNPRQPGLDRDEYPPAMFQEGGTGSSVRGIDPSDNRGAGSSMGHQARDYADGTRVRLVVSD